MVVAGMFAAVVAALAVPAVASAITITSMSASPASTQAGGHSDFTLSLSFGNASDQLSSMTVHLPPGLVAAPAAATECTHAAFASGSCPAASVVGHSTANTSLGDASGDVYVLVPNAGEPARIGVVVRPPGSSPVELEAPITVRPGDYGFDARVAGIPRSVVVGGAVTVPIDISELSMTLDGSAAHGPFVELPTSCARATTRVDVTAYSGPGDSKSASFTPTGCGALPYQPRLAGTVYAGADRSHPPVTTEISQPAGQAASRSVALTLPSALGANPAALGRACPSDTAAAGGCPASATIGTAVATTPLLPVPLTGQAVLVSLPGTVLPQIEIDFAPPFPIRLVASAGLSGSRLTATIDGLPDVPLSSVTLSFAGGSTGLVVATRDLCETPAGTVDGAFVGHNGAGAQASAPVLVAGCGSRRRPHARATRPGRRRPWLRIRVGAARGAPPLRTVSIRLPRALTLVRSRGLSLPGIRIRHTRRLVTLKAGRRGKRTLRLRIPASVLHVRRARRLRITLRVTDVTGATLTLTVPVRRR